MRVAFIGLGAMGGPMATNLAASEHEIAVYNRTPKKAADLGCAGAKVAETPAAAAREADIVCTCVSTPDALRAVLLGDDGAIAGAKSGTLFIDFSTVDPLTSKAMTEACRAAGCAYLEAPVSGGVGGAKAGTLTIIAGGDDADFERARPVFEVVGKQFTLVGPVGAGSTIKLINQMLVGANLAAVLEAFVLGEMAGIAPEKLYEMLSQSTGNSAMLKRAVLGNLLPRNYEPGFAVGLLLKDIDLALGLGEALQADLPMTATARRVYEEARAGGFQDKDITAAILPKEQKHGIQIKGSEG